MPHEQILEGISRALHEARSSQALTLQMLGAIAQSLETTLAGAFLIGTHGRRPHVAIGDRVHQVDELQIVLDEGPGLDAGDGVATVRSDDLASDERWPQWSEAASDLGIRSMVCSRLMSQGLVVASLQVYATTAGRFTAEDAAVCDLLAHTTAVGVHAMLREHDFDQALETRTLIGQAQGILMERFGIEDGQSFEVLKRYSQSLNIKLAVFAEELVRTRQLPDQL